MTGRCQALESTLRGKQLTIGCNNSGTARETLLWLKLINTSRYFSRACATCLDVVNQNSAARPNCMVNELARRRQVYQEISIVHIFDWDAHVLYSRLR
jgi:hypothetical protein